MPSERAGKSRLALDDFVPYRLSVLTNRVSSAIARQVAARTAMDKVQVSRAVASLTRAKRVARAGDAEDGRVKRLSLTAKGRAIHDEIVPLALHLEEVLLSALTQEERRGLDQAMRKLTDRVARRCVRVRDTSHWVFV